MYRYIKCVSCNNSLAEYYRIFDFIKEKKFEELGVKTEMSICNYQIDDNIEIVFEDIFDLLNIKKWCCRKSMFTYVEFIELSEL